jgi:phage replication O-like protein O
VANPQKEHGYTAIANEIMDALIKVDLSGQQFKIALLIIRKTYGFNKKDDAVSLTQMMSFTGMGKIRCSQVVNQLQLMKILTVTENINGICKKYKLNKDFEEWPTVTENINRYRKTKSTVNVLRNRPLMKTLTTKDTITKDTITKDKAHAPVIPEWIPKNTFQEYLEMRRKIRKPLLEKSFSRFFSALKKLCDTTTASPEQILDQSIINSWQGIFPLKIGGNGNGGIRTARSDPRDRSLQSREDAEVAAIIARREAAKQSARRDPGGDAKPDDAPDFSNAGLTE